MRREVTHWGDGSAAPAVLKNAGALPQVPSHRAPLAARGRPFRRRLVGCLSAAPPRPGNSHAAATRGTFAQRPVGHQPELAARERRQGPAQLRRQRAPGPAPQARAMISSTITRPRPAAAAAVLVPMWLVPQHHLLRRHQLGYNPGRREVLPNRRPKLIQRAPPSRRRPPAPSRNPARRRPEPRPFRASGPPLAGRCGQAQRQVGLTLREIFRR